MCHDAIENTRRPGGFTARPTQRDRLPSSLRTAALRKQIPYQSKDRKGVVQRQQNTKISHHVAPSFSMTRHLTRVASIIYKKIVQTSPTNRLTSGDKRRKPDWRKNDRASYSTTSSAARPPVLLHLQPGQRGQRP